MRILVGALLFLATTASAQEKPPADQRIHEFLSARARDLEKDFLPEVKTKEDFESARSLWRRQYLEMLGLWPLPQKTPLRAVITGRLEEGSVTIEKLYFQSRPGLYVTANLYLPRPAKGPYPAILYSCSHYRVGRNGNKSACSDHGLWFAEHGYVCLIYDTIELGEVNSTHHGTYREDRWWWQSMGYTPAGVECWNAIRGLDYLQSRPEVDPERIGATGISGGGAATFWISAADERVKVSVPVSGMSDLGWYVGEDGIQQHCDCMFLLNRYRWNWTMIAALVCPRPLLFVNSDQDRYFPMSANERIINRLKRLYGKYLESDQVESIVSVGGHDYRSDLRRAIFEFLNRHLKGDARRVQDADSGLTRDGKFRIDPSALRVMEDRDIPADCRNSTIDETFLAPAILELPSPDQFVSWRDGLVDHLRKDCFPLESSSGMGAFLRDLPSGDAVPWVLLQNPGETPLGEAPPWAVPLVGSAPLGILQPSSGWTRRKAPNTVEREMPLLGLTADSIRVWDILRAVGGRGRPVRLIGRGEAGILGAYAALLDPASIESVTIVDPPASHRSGPQFLGVLRIWDIPEALGCLAPRPLTLIHAADPAFERTAELYRRAGAAGKLLRN
jgi:dienelactone hydrolase